MSFRQRCVGVTQSRIPQGIQQLWSAGLGLQLHRDGRAVMEDPSPEYPAQSVLLVQLKPQWAHPRVMSSLDGGADFLYLTLGLICGHFSCLPTCFYILIFLLP